MLHYEASNRTNLGYRKKPDGKILPYSFTSLGPHTSVRQEKSVVVSHHKWFANGQWYENRSESSPAGAVLTVSTAQKVSSVISNNRAATINRGLQKLKDQRFNLGVFLAEAPETASFLVSGAKTIVTAFRKSRIEERKIRALYEKLQRIANGKSPTRARRSARAELRRLGNLSDRIAAIWLGWRYGVMPIVYDIQGIIEELSRERETKGSLIHVKTSKSVDDVFEFPESMRYRYNGYDRCPTVQTLSVTHRISIVAKVTRNRTVAQLGLVNGLELIWEATPLSFVVDWVLNLGETLSVLDAGFGIEFVGGTISEKREIRVVRDARSQRRPNSTPTNYRDDSCTGCTTVEKYYKRDVLSGLPTPQFYVQPNMNVKRWLDAVALLKVIVLKS